MEASLAYAESVRLNYEQNSFVIEFSTFNYSDAGLSKFAYKLEGYDDTWSAPSSLNFAAYKNLPPGSYHLHVKARNTAGTWSDESVLKIVVVPPFWETTWAMLIYVLLSIAVLYAAYRIISKMNTLRNKIKVEEQLTEYKLMFLQIYRMSSVHL